LLAISTSAFITVSLTVISYCTVSGTTITATGTIYAAAIKGLLAVPAPTFILFGHGGLITWNGSAWVQLQGDVWPDYVFSGTPIQDSAGAFACLCYAGTSGVVDIFLAVARLSGGLLTKPGRVSLAASAANLALLGTGLVLATSVYPAGGSLGTTNAAQLRISVIQLAT
jgi:hypothetical protein